MSFQICIRYQCGQSFTGICPTLSAPRNGDMNVSNYFVGGTANFICNEGFGMVGIEQIICAADGIWSQQPPVCNRKIIIFIVYAHGFSYI